VVLYFGRIRTLLRVVYFQISRYYFDFLPLNLLLVRFHQAEIIIVKRLIQGRNNVSDEVGVECRSCDYDHDRHKNDAL